MGGVYNQIDSNSKYLKPVLAESSPLKKRK